MITLVSRTITCASWPLPRPGGGVPPLPLAHRVSRERGLPRCADHPLGRRSRRATHPSPPEGSRRPRGCPTLLHRAPRYPLHRQPAPAKMPCHWPRPKRLRRRSSRAAPHRMALMPLRSHLALLRRRSRQSPCHLTVERPALRRDHRRTSAAIPRTAHDGRRRGAPSPRLSGAISGNATKDAAATGIRSPGAAATPGRPGRRPGAGKSQVIVLCSSPHAPRPRTGSAAGAT